MRQPAGAGRQRPASRLLWEGRVRNIIRLPMYPIASRYHRLTRSAPLLATILVLFGIGYTIDYNSEPSEDVPSVQLTRSAPQAPQERPPLECPSDVGEHKMHGIAWTGR